MHTQNIYDELARTANIIAMPFYWLDLEQVIRGANDLTIATVGAASSADVIGKSPYDLYPYNLAHAIVLHHQAVINSGETLVVEEAIKNITTGAIQYYTATIWICRDAQGAIIGTVGTSTDITNKKIADERLKYEKILTHLRFMAEVMPIPFYWLDKDQKYLGVNDVVLQLIGANFSQQDLIGKTPLDIYPEAMARDIMLHHSEVVHTGQLFLGEEAVQNITTKEVVHFNAIVGPLRDDDGNIIGTMGTSIDITAKKEAECLALENKNQKIEYQEKLISLAHKVAHDISSPLSALGMMMHACDELPEKKRIVIKRAAESILDIANNLLSTYRNEEQRAISEIERRQPLLISDLLVQLLSEKKAQYSNHAVRLETDIADEAQFAFADMQVSQFRRALSNLINNAVDAMDSNNGLVTIKLTADAQSIIVVVQDNGKGMPTSLIQKMLSRQSFTEGKANGHGLGLQQVWDTLDDNQGIMTVNSIPGVGSTIQLSFPRITAATWIAQTIHLVPNSIIAVLDDEESIHGAWETRFAPYQKLYPSLNVHHFKQGQEALDFFSTLSPQDKNRVVFLSDYELLRQSKNGLQVIEESEIKNTTLVTSYYANAQIRDKALPLGVKILPKQMASIVPIDVDVNVGINSAVIAC